MKRPPNDIGRRAYLQDSRSLLSSYFKEPILPLRPVRIGLTRCRVTYVRHTLKAEITGDSRA